MRYFRYLLLPLLILLLLAGRWLYLGLRLEPPLLTLLDIGEAASADVYFDLAARAGVSGLRLADPGGKGAADLILIEGGFVPAAREALAGGRLHRGLDLAQDLTAGGAQALVSWRSLLGTENPQLAAALRAWSGGSELLWQAYYLEKPAMLAELPAAVRTALAAAEALPSAAGGSLVLFSPRDGRAVLLRRGIELERDFMRIRGQLGDIPVDSLYGGSFAILAPSADSRVLLSGRLGLSAAGQALAQSAGIPAEFAMLTVRPYGHGQLWTLAFDLPQTNDPLRLPPLFGTARLNLWRSLDEPTDTLARLTRLQVPLWRNLSRAALDSRQYQASRAASAVAASLAVRAGQRYLERQGADGRWQPWFPKGVNLGPALPGRWFGEPPVEDHIYLDWLEAISAAGFDSIRLYTLLPPAFYRALAVHNLARPDKPLYLIQEIWPEELVPDHNLADPAYLRAYFEESDRTLDALFGQISIDERPFRAWGDYRTDISPWLAAVLVGRELEPEEVLATRQLGDGAAFTGHSFTVAAGQPVEAVLARMADRAAQRLAELGRTAVPIGFVSWPTLDMLDHPAEWAADATTAPFNDRASVDFRLIRPTTRNQAGFFTAYHVYPNYPDFMIRSRAYESPGDTSGYGRYAAYLRDLLATQEGIPLLIAEFGLATGHGTAHRHPQGLDHGGLTEERQAAALVGLFETIAAEGGAGALLFQWSDEWAKKTWTTETYMIPYDRNPLWHNVIDPEQNYGIMAWEQQVQPSIGAQSPDGSLRVWADTGYLHVEFHPDEAAAELLATSGYLDIGLDVVPGRTGEYRLYPGGPLAPQGSEFVLRVAISEGKLDSASLLVHADYNRGGGRLFPRYSELGGYTRILTLVNGAIINREGRIFPSIWEDGSLLPQGPGGLARQGERGSLHFRLPWGRLNFADPSSRLVLFDPVADARQVAARDSLGTLQIDAIGLWAHVRARFGPARLYYPSADSSLRVPLAGWEAVESRLVPKQAYRVLADFLPAWRPSLFGRADDMD